MVGKRYNQTVPEGRPFGGLQAEKYFERADTTCPGATKHSRAGEQRQARPAHVKMGFSAERCSVNASTPASRHCRKQSVENARPCAPWAVQKPYLQLSRKPLILRALKFASFAAQKHSLLMQPRLRQKKRLPSDRSATISGSRKTQSRPYSLISV